MFGCHLLRKAFLDYPTKTVTLYHNSLWGRVGANADRLHMDRPTLSHSCKFSLPWLYQVPLTPFLSLHSPFKMPSHLCKHPYKSELSSVHAGLFSLLQYLCYWLKSVLTTFNQCPDLFIFDTRHEAKSFPLQHLIWFSREPYEMRSLLTDGETEGQGSHLLKTTEQVRRRACSPTHCILPTRALSQRRKKSFESENNILIPKVTRLQVPSRDWSCAQVWEPLAHHPSAVGDSAGRQDWGLQGAGFQASAVTPIFLRSAQKLCFSASQVIDSDPGIQPQMWFYSILGLLCETRFRWQDEGLPILLLLPRRNLLCLFSVRLEIQPNTPVKSTEPRMGMNNVAGSGLCSK